MTNQPNNGGDQSDAKLPAPQRPWREYLVSIIRWSAAGLVIGVVLGFLLRGRTEVLQQVLHYGIVGTLAGGLVAGARTGLLRRTHLVCGAILVVLLFAILRQPRLTVLSLLMLGVLAVLVIVLCALRGRPRVVFISVLTLGILAVGIGLVQSYMNYRLDQWEEVEATVTMSRIISSQPGDAAVSVQYEYVVDGRPLTGEQVYEFEVRPRRGRATEGKKAMDRELLRQRVVREVKANSPGTDIVVYYDPDDLTTSQIDKPAINRIHPMLLIGIGGGFLLVALWVWYFPELALGAAWIGMALASASGLSVMFAEYILREVRESHSDGAGFGLFATPVVFAGIIVLFTIAYGVHHIFWLKRERRMM